MATVTDSTTFSVEFILIMTKKGRPRKVIGNKVQHFLQVARDGAAMKYLDFLSPKFSSSDFYAIIDIAIFFGLVKKEGCRYRFDKDFNAKFKEALVDYSLAAMSCYG
jgi:hypothetical protein